MHLLTAISERKLNFSESIELLRDVAASEDSTPIFGILQNRINLHDSSMEILDSILIAKGFYPYVDSEVATTGPQGIAYEFHKSDNIPFTFHREQRNVLSLLNENKSVVLCAPTSFGKSLLIEEIIASGRFNNIVVIQPTLALIDETRKKLRSYSNYKTIFSKSQEPGEKNIYLLTAERFVEFPFNIEVDFFIIDEFYKLDFEGPDRRDILNVAFYRLLKKTKSFYLLGPPVKMDSQNIKSQTGCEVVGTDFTTVATKMEFVGEETFENLVNSLNSADGQSLIYARSPNSAEEICTELTKEFPNENKYHEDFISWCSSNVHPNWSLYLALRNGIAFHHAQMPRYVGNYIVESFNKGTIKMLVCTSTLMEGVNTTAKNVLVYHLTKGTTKLTTLDFKNISGRAGRMKKHFVGRVIVFSKDLQLKDPELMIPSITTNTASDELVIQMSDQDLVQDKIERKKEIEQTSALPIDVLKKNPGIPIENQIKLYEALMALENSKFNSLIWNGQPNWDKLVEVCSLIFSNFKVSSDLIRTGRQLAFFVNLYRSQSSSSAVINYLVTTKNEPVDKAIRETFGRIRGWSEFRLPKLLLTTQDIIQVVAVKKGILTQSLDYSFFAATLENGFLDKGISSLRELGLPAELLKKLTNKVDLESPPEDIIRTLKRISLEGGLHPFEISLLKDL